MALLVQLDSNLALSQNDATFGGSFGTPYWFFNQAKLGDSGNINYLMQWQTFSSLQNISALLSFLLWRFCGSTIDNDAYLELYGFKDKSEPVKM